MANTSTGDPLIDELYKARKGKVEFIEVPELGFAVVDGRGAPGGAAFTEALQALYSVSYTAHFLLKKEAGNAPRVMPLEGLWWMEGTEAQATMERIAAGDGTMDESDREQWHWRTMIMQLPPIDEAMIERAVAEARAKKNSPSLGTLRYERWTEGASAQLLHIGPYSQETANIIALHAAIAEHGLRPRGRHHEIYLGDPRRSAPEKLRTILRHPVEPAV
jgi:hypothetical protein